MEKVWEDINVSSLHQHHQHHHHSQANSPYNHNTFKGINLQEFLARPFERDQSFGSSIAAVAPPPPPPPPPQASLCLNTVGELYYLDNNSNSNNSNDAFESCSAFPPFCKKRSSESEDSNGDRRHKRMIKNRESAARSRARKQSYTNELEIKVADLTEENKRLLKQQEELYFAAAAAVAVQLPKKHNLQRSSSAPF